MSSIIAISEESRVLQPRDELAWIQLAVVTRVNLRILLYWNRWHPPPDKEKKDTNEVKICFHGFTSRNYTCWSVLEVRARQHIVSRRKSTFRPRHWLVHSKQPSVHIGLTFWWHTVQQHQLRSQQFSSVVGSRKRLRATTEVSDSKKWHFEPWTMDMKTVDLPCPQSLTILNPRNSIFSLRSSHSGEIGSTRVAVLQRKNSVSLRSVKLMWGNLIPG
jgi:hypothetical protein